jgi:hypothetical protein
VILKTSFIKMYVTTKTTWKVMTVLREAILSCDGMIFGGYVRDMILHDHYAQKFYKEINNTDIASVRYADATCSPDTWDRTLVPSDIDCVIDTINFEKFKQIVKNKRLKMKMVATKDPLEYNPDFDTSQSSTVVHHVVEISLNKDRVIKELKSLQVDTRVIRDFFHLKIEDPCIKMDILVTEKPVDHPFFGVADFECNTLYLTKHGFGLSPEICPQKDILTKKLEIDRIMDDIINHRAKFMRTSHGSRCVKLFRKGWTVYDRFLTSIKDKNYDGYCIICHDELPETHFKMNCCDARYHSKCLGKFLDNQNGTIQQCPLCKNHCVIGEEHERLLACIDIYV